MQRLFSQKLRKRKRQATEPSEAAHESEEEKEEEVSPPKTGSKYYSSVARELRDMSGKFTTMIQVP